MSKQHLDKPAVINGVYLFGERHATRWKGCEGQRSHADMRPQPALVRPLGRGVGKVTVLVTSPGLYMPLFDCVLDSRQERLRL